MKKFFLICLGLIATIPVFAQEVSFHRSSYFQEFDYTTAPTGFFRDIAVDPVDLDRFDGTVITDSNYVNIVTMAGLFRAIQTADVSEARNWSYSFPSKVQGVIPLLIALYEYNFLDQNSFASGAVAHVNGHLRRANTSIPCYKSKYLVAITSPYPYESSLYTRFQFNYLPNKNVSYQSIELDAGDGFGYRNALGVSGIDIHYSTPGVKEVRMRYRINGEYIESHTQVYIDSQDNGLSPEVMSSSFPIDSVSCSYQGEDVSAVIEYHYSEEDNVLHKPFIFVEGFDPWDLLQQVESDTTIDSELGLTSLKDIKRSIHEIDPTFDIVYINWLNSEADIRANAALLIKIIKEKINPFKVSTEPSIILGESMGGLIVRYALCKMDYENNHSSDIPYDYQISTFISHDAPHLGISIPVSALSAARALIDYLSKIDLLKEKWEDSKSVLLKYLDGMSAKQMLFNYLDENGEINRTWHDAFFSELSSIGNFPVGSVESPFRSIAITEGGDSRLVSLLQTSHNHYLDASLRVDSGIILKCLLGILDPLLVNKLSLNGNLSWYYYLPGSSEIKYALTLNADNGLSSYLMKFEGWYTKKLFGFISVRDDLVSKRFTTSCGSQSREMAQGSLFSYGERIDSLVDTINHIPWYIRLIADVDSLATEKVDHFMFVPTESALASKHPDFSRQHLSSPLSPMIDIPFHSYLLPSSSLEHVSTESWDYDWLKYEIGATIVGSNHGMTGYSYSVSSLPIGVDSSAGQWSSSNTNIAEIDNDGVLTVHSNGKIEICYSLYDDCKYYGVNKWIEVSTESDVTSIQLYLDGVLDNGCYYARVNPLTNADRINWNLAMQDSVVRQNCTYSWRYMLDFGALRNSESGSLAELYDDLEEGEFPSLSIMPMLRDANNIIRVFFTVSEHLGETTKSKTISKAFYVDDLNAQLWPQSLIVNPNQIMAVYGGAVQDVFLSPPPRLIHQNSVASVSILDEEGVELTELPVESEGYVQLFDNDEVLDFLDEVLIQNEEMTVLRFILKDASGQVLEERTLPIVVKDVTYEAL